MKVIIIAEFPNINDVDGEEASQVVDALTLDTVRMAEEWADKEAVVWVDDVVSTSKRDIVSKVFDQIQQDMRDGDFLVIEALLSEIPLSNLEAYLSSK